MATVKLMVMPPLRGVKTALRSPLEVWLAVPVLLAAPPWAGLVIVVGPVRVVVGPLSGVDVWVPTISVGLAPVTVTPGGIETEMDATPKPGQTPLYTGRGEIPGI